MEKSLVLEQLGLTRIEALVYIELLKIGSTTTGPLVKKTELHRTTVYDVLKRLSGKGLVNYIVKEKTKYFEATEPYHFLDAIEDEKNKLLAKEKIAKKAISDLVQIKKEAKRKEIAHIFQGKRGVKTVFLDILNYKENWVLGSSGKFKDILGDFFLLFQKMKRKKKIHTKLLASERVRGTDIETSVYGDRRFIPKEFESPISTIIYGDKVATFIWLDNPIALMIESKEAANSYRNYFKVMWKVAKK